MEYLSVNTWYRPFIVWPSTETTPSRGSDAKPSGVIVCSVFNYIEFGGREFNKVADISAGTVKNHFGNWKKGLAALRQHLQKKGLDLSPRPHPPNRIYSDKALFEEMERIWMKVSHRPSCDEWNMYDPKISYGTYPHRFGSWTNACLKFIEHKMGRAVLIDDELLTNIKGRPDVQIIGSSLPNKEKDTRTISLGVRLKVLNRDNFRCVFCGKSPATDIGTKLHIDHIEPFSKGGKSTLENLQTLCEECNLGKSNKENIIRHQ